MKKLLTKSIALLMVFALIFGAMPMMLASAEDYPEDLLLATGSGENGWYHPGGLGGADCRWDAQRTTASYANNIRLMPGYEMDLSAYNTVTVNFWYENQDQYNYWKDYMFWAIGDAYGVNVYYPLNTTYPAPGIYTAELDLAYAENQGLDTTAITYIAMRSLPNGYFRDHKANWDVGYNTADESVPDIHFSLTHFYAKYIPEELAADVEAVTAVHPGNYHFYDAAAGNRDWVAWEESMVDPIDVSDADYLEANLWISDAAALAAEANADGAALVSSFNIRIGSTSGAYNTFSYPIADLKSGFNTIKIPMNQLTYANSLQFVRVWTEPYVNHTPSKPYTYGFIDLKAVKKVVDNTPPEDMLLTNGAGDQGSVWHPGGFTYANKTFNPHVTSGGWENNLFYRPASPFDLSRYNTISISFFYDDQDAYDYWKDYCFWNISDGKTTVSYPLNTTFTEPGVYTVELDLDFAAAHGVNKGNIKEIAFRSLTNGNFRSNRTNADIGFKTDDETAPDFHFTLTDITAKYIAPEEGTVAIDKGNYAFYDAAALNRDFVIWSKTLAAPVNVTGCDYVSVTVNMSNVEKLKTEVDANGTNLVHTLYFRIGNSESTCTTIGYKLDQLKDGFNEILIPVSKIGDAASIKFVKFFTEGFVSCAPSHPYTWGFTDIKGVKDVVPAAVDTREVVSVPVPSDLTEVNTTTWLQDRYQATFDAVDISGKDYLEFDLWVNNDTFVSALTGSLQFCLGSNPDNKYDSRLIAAINDQVVKTGWNHIAIPLATVYKEPGFNADSVCRFFMGISGAAVATPLYVNIANVEATVHAGDVNGDKQVNLNDLIRMKKAIAGSAESFDELALDVNADGTMDSAGDLAFLRQFLLGSVTL